MNNQDLYFKNEETKYIFYLVALEGKIQLDFLNIDRGHYENRQRARNWYEEIKKKIKDSKHPRLEGDDFMAFSIRLTEEEKNLATSYAKLNSLSLGEAFKKALFEKIEEEYDIVIAEESFKKYIDSGKKSRPFSELKKELGL